MSARRSPVGVNSYALSTDAFGSRVVVAPRHRTIGSDSSLPVTTVNPWHLFALVRKLPNIRRPLAVSSFSALSDALLALAMLIGLGSLATPLRHVCR